MENILELHTFNYFCLKVHCQKLTGVSCLENLLYFTRYDISDMKVLDRSLFSNWSWETQKLYIPTYKSSPMCWLEMRFCQKVHWQKLTGASCLESKKRSCGSAHKYPTFFLALCACSSAFQASCSILILATKVYAWRGGILKPRGH